jgi:hypothetical protein
MEIIYSIITTYQIWLTGTSISANGNLALCWLMHILFLDVLSAVPPFFGGTARSLVTNKYNCQRH